MGRINVDNYDKVLKWSYNLARKWARENLVPRGVVSARKFFAYVKSGQYLPAKFPRRPDDHFRNKNSWKGWPDFLGYPDQRRGKSFLNLRDASRLTREAKISNSRDFKNWKGRPVNVPSRPDLYYPDWKGWKDFLGEGYKVERKRTYAKLTEADVRIIKHQLNMGVSGSVLARNFKISEMQISRIKSGTNWKNI
ncbi:MAG: hypothetical protein ACOCYF_02520 [Bacteroidota bacterium]